MASEYALGAPTDLLRPMGRLAPVDPGRAPPGARGSAVRGIALAILWAAWTLVLLLAGQSFAGAARGALPRFLLLAAIIGPLVAVNLHAMSRRRTNVLTGFWTTVAIAALFSIVTWFALLRPRLA